MNEDVVMEIFGQPESLDVLADVLDAARSDGAGTGWDEYEASEEQLVAAAVDAVDEADMLRITLNDTRRPFPQTRAACKAAGLCYIVSAGPTGSEGYDRAVYWKPGMDDEFSSMIDGVAPMFSLSEIKQAYGEGLSGIEKCIARLDQLTLADVPKTLAASGEVTQNLKEWHERLKEYSKRGRP